MNMGNMNAAQMQQLMNNLPAGISKDAVAADPQGYQNWLAQAQAQEAKYPGSTMLAPQQSQPAQPSGMREAVERAMQAGQPQLGMTNQQAAQAGQLSQKGGQPPSPQQLGQGLQQQAAMQQRMPQQAPMRQQAPMQRPPQGGLSAQSRMMRGRFR
jgi:hypothetical protein